MSVAFTSCGKRVEVPTAHVGFVKTKAGISEEVKQPSSFRLPASISSKPELIVIETSSFTEDESFSLFLPKDKLKLTFDVRGIFSIITDKAPDIMQQIPTVTTDRDRVLGIPSANVYNIYARQVIRTTVI